ncbi:sporulation histidine kinase inhibitor Sda [Cohnella fermenti]|uniref:Sporulation histidine kinase inhibitor Sda n=1 Tax=Cohnella fermenti TaxID=2565925 RepID=A0A4S4C4T5_9BACL|nr:sporulation histidine kinase inhibitor Sda [Cohnella fermenti]THF82592.1 sporulation histidine kinase inhibitor Sda [Cohnella fermenti]
MLPILSDEILLEAYTHATLLQLDPEFLELLLSEIKRRKLSLPNEGDLAG